MAVVSVAAHRPPPDSLRPGWPAVVVLAHTRATAVTAGLAATAVLLEGLSAATVGWAATVVLLGVVPAAAVGWAATAVLCRGISAAAAAAATGLAAAATGVAATAATAVPATAAARGRHGNDSLSPRLRCTQAQDLEPNSE